MVFFSSVLSLAAFMVYCQGHMIMSYPPPLGNPTKDPINQDGNDPVSSQGGPFPCKARSTTDYQNAQVTTVQIGETFPVSFRGTAVHGGGSCQFSLSKDSTPTDTSVFKVIKSVEGGCPARNQTGNIEDSSNDISEYNVTIPQGLQPGRYTFAWTWVNKVGNSEFYMNCAVLQIQDGKENITSTNNRTQSQSPRPDDTVFNSLPPMILVNTYADDCKDIKPGPMRYAQPGTMLEINEEIPKENLVLPQCVPGGHHLTQVIRDDDIYLSTPTTEFPSTSVSVNNDNNKIEPTNIWTTLNSNSDFMTDLSDPRGFASPTATTPLPFSSSTTSSTTLTFPPNNSPPSSSSSSVVSFRTSTSTSTLSNACINSLSAHHLCTSIGFQCHSQDSFVNCAFVDACAVVQPIAYGTVCVDDWIEYDTTYAL